MPARQHRGPPRSTAPGAVACGDEPIGAEGHRAGPLLAVWPTALIASPE